MLDHWSTHPNDARVSSPSYIVSRHTGSKYPLTISVAVTFMIEFSKEPSSLFGSTLQGIQPKLYAMGLMYALNQRVAMEDEKDETETVSFQLYQVCIC